MNEVPSIPESLRSKALSTYLEDLVTTSMPPHNSSAEKDASACWIRNLKRKVLPEAEKHIFSHVRHTMWIEYHAFLDEWTMTPPQWTSPQGRSLRWMSREDMEKVGVTSEVKKVLNAAEGPVLQKKVGA